MPRKTKKSKKMSPQLKAFLRKYKRFPRKGELGRARTRKTARRSAPRKTRRYTMPKRKKGHRRSAKRYSLGRLIGGGWTVYNLIGEPIVIGAQNKWPAKAYFEEMLHRMSGCDTSGGKITSWPRFRTLAENYGPAVVGEVVHRGANILKVNSVVRKVPIIGKKVEL